MKKRDIPKSILHRVEAELLADERLLWLGLPDSRRLMGQRGATKDYRVNVLLMGLMALFLGTIFATGGAASPILYGSLFLLLFFSAIFVPMLSRYLRAKQTIYAVTNRRAVVIEPDKVQSFGENELQHIERHRHNDGTGDIIFKTDYYLQTVAAPYAMVQQRAHITHGFLGVENPEQLEALLLETFQNNEGHSSRLLDKAIAEPEMLDQIEDEMSTKAKF